ncbi:MULTISPECIES: integrase [Streptomyces]|uniref:integrase n=1 Tax=Streptomyces TaxID=1883 RepID=UPI001FD0A8F3|nr:integrase [Streptomyces kasugaensis]
MTYEELLALPAAVDLDTANKALTIGRSTGYALAKRDEYPVTVLKLGNAYRVVTAELHRLLGVQPEEAVGCCAPST